MDSEYDWQQMQILDMVNRDLRHLYEKKAELESLPYLTNTQLVELQQIKQNIAELEEARDMA